MTNSIDLELVLFGLNRADRYNTGWRARSPRPTNEELAIFSVRVRTFSLLRTSRLSSCRQYVLDGLDDAMKTLASSSYKFADLGDAFLHKGIPFDIGLEFRSWQAKAYIRN